MSPAWQAGSMHQMAVPLLVTSSIRSHVKLISWPLCISSDRQKAICCVSLRCDYESLAKSRVALRGEKTLPKTTRIYLL
eukprot:3751621-Pleurochrysis_carterae.AAC.1